MALCVFTLNESDIVRTSLILKYASKIVTKRFDYLVNT